jgi:hypothetical protein
VIAFIAGLALVFNASEAARWTGILLVLASALTCLGLLVVSSAVSTYAQTMIYRYAVGRPIPIPAELIDGAFVPKRGRRR